MPRPPTMVGLFFFSFSFSFLKSHSFRFTTPGQRALAFFPPSRKIIGWHLFCKNILKLGRNSP